MDIESLPRSNAIYLIDGCNVISKKYPTYYDYIHLLWDIKEWIIWKSRRNGKRPKVVVFFDSGAKQYTYDYPKQLMDLIIQFDENSNADSLLLEYLRLHCEGLDANVYVVSSDYKDIVSNVKHLKNVETIDKNEFQRKLEVARRSIELDLQDKDIQKVLEKIHLEEKNKLISRLIPSGAKYQLRNKVFFFCEIVSVELIKSLHDSLNQANSKGIFLVIIIDVTNEGSTPDYLGRINTFYIQDELGNVYEPSDVYISSVAESAYGLGGFYDDINPRETKRIVAVFDIPVDSVENIKLKAHEVSETVKETLNSLRQTRLIMEQLRRLG